MNALDLQALNTLRQILGPKLDRIVDAFVSQLPGAVAELQALHAGQDWPQLALRAHALKGSCANMGACELARLATTIELAGKQGDAPALAVPMDALPSAAQATVAALREQGYWNGPP